MGAEREKLTGPRLLVGGAGDCPDMEYASGFRAPDPVVLLCEGRRRLLVVSELEFGRASRCGPRTTALTPSMLGVRAASRHRLAEWAHRLLKREGVSRVVVDPAFPFGVGSYLRARRIRVDICSGALFPERAVKSPDECRKIRESQQAAVIAMRAATALISGAEIGRGGFLQVRGHRLTAEAVRRTIARALLDHDCVARDTIVAGGSQAVDPHEAGHGPLMAHRPIVIDIFPQHEKHGYWGDITRTLVRGNPTPEARAMYAAVKAAQGAALNAIRPGVKCSTVHRRAADELERRGFATEVRNGRHVGFIHGTGHGVGLSIHEAPSIGRSGTRLRSGHVITVEPGLYYPEIGGVRIEDTVRVTADGWRYLAPCERKFEV